MKGTAIARIEVQDLHSQFNVFLDFLPGLNVLYGKNGRGKTTLLHILANFQELDFQQFRYLQFRRIEIQTFAADRFTIERQLNGAEHWISLFVNGERVGGHGVVPALDAALRSTLRQRIGGIPTYLPAFRAILERVKSEAYAAPANRDDGFDRIRTEERQVQSELEADRPTMFGWSHRYDLAALTARKTVQCREWFGPFVPVVRYPSIREVTDRLGTEFRDAQVETGMHERQMLSAMFIEVFKVLVSDEEVPTESEVDALMQRVRTALIDEDGKGQQELYTDQIGNRLAEVVDLVKTRGTQQGGAAERRVLRLYAQMLEQRNKDRRRAFSRVREFEQAVNRFFEEKSLHITDDQTALQPRRVGPEAGAYVQTKGDRRYALSSLSSGERQVLTMLFSATRMSSATGAFLIDEPELSLHIDWQRMVLSELMAQAGDRQIIACTHSPEVGAEHRDALQMFAPEESVLALPSLPSDSPDSTLDDSL